MLQENLLVEEHHWADRVQAAEAQEEYEEWVGSWGGQAEEVAEARGGDGLKEGEGVKVSHPVSVTIDNRTWYRQPGQPDWAGCLEETAEAAGVPATEAVQPVAEEEAGLDGKVEAAGAEEVDRGGESASCAP